MKRLIFLPFILPFLFSCKKEIQNSDSSGSMRNVQAALKDSLSLSDYSSLNFSKAIVSNTDCTQIYFLRIPFTGKKIENDFLLLKTNTEGMIEGGKIIHIEGEEIERRWKGNITISSLDRKKVLNSAINDGYIMALHPQANLRTEIMAPVYPDPYIILPEVVVVATVTSTGSISFSDWILLTSLYNSTGGSGGVTGAVGSGGSGGYYSPLSGGTTSTSVGSGKAAPTQNSIFIDYENQYNNPAIDVKQYIRCFANIPDAGASYSIEILTDIPVDGDPTKFFDWSNGSPGHTFLQIRKSNGGQTVLQNIGFYPKSGWKTTLTTAPIDGKFVDNGGHEYNASLKVNINAAQLQLVLNKIQYLAGFVKYDIDEYNCTDWALEVFNTARNSASQLVIPKYDLPGDAAPYGTSTPNGLYIKLQQIKNSGGPDAVNVDIGFKKGYVASSTGPCN